MSTSVLAQRLIDLQEAKLVERSQTGEYMLTEHAAQLLTGSTDWLNGREHSVPHAS